MFSIHLIYNNILNSDMRGQNTFKVNIHQYSSRQSSFYLSRDHYTTPGHCTYLLIDNYLYKAVGTCIYKVKKKYLLYLLTKLSVDSPVPLHKPTRIWGMLFFLFVISILQNS